MGSREDCVPLAMAIEVEGQEEDWEVSRLPPVFLIPF